VNAPANIANPLAKLREPFPPNQISKLPKPLRRDAQKGKCSECGGYHGLPAIHLDYVGHAALTDRLLDTDPEWNWEPMGYNPDGTPALDRNGGLWIKLTVCGVTRPGYGCADGKSGGDAMKEIIGDALRNAAMRFGAALDLWHKGDLHAEEEGAPGGADQGQSQDGEVGPDGPAKRIKLAGPYTSKTALQTAVKGFVREMQGTGDWDEWCVFRDLPETRALLEQVQRDMPQWWDGGPDMPEEFVPLHRQIEIHETNFANQIADYARA
jgi:hypothetical protein